MKKRDVKLMKKALELFISIIIILIKVLGCLSGGIAFFCIIYYALTENQLITFDNPEKTTKTVIVIIVITAIIFIVEEIFKISKYSSKKENLSNENQKGDYEENIKKSKKHKLELALWIVFTILLIILSAKYQSNIIGYFASSTPSAPSSGISENGESDKPSKPKYTSPQNINSCGNPYYQNNGGCFCEQDGVYYIATANGIYSSSNNFENFTLLNDSTSAMNLNVIGDYIFYSTGDGIYRMRLDGEMNQKLIDTGCQTISMQVQNSMIYYINAMDFKLYIAPALGGSAAVLYDNEIIQFLINGAYIYVIDANIEQSLNSYSHIRRFKSLTRMLTNGSEKTVISDKWNTEYKDIFDIGICNDNLYFCLYDGLYTSTFPNNECFKVDESFGSRGLSIYNNNAYYMTYKNKKTHFIQTNLINNYSKDYGALFNNDTQTQWIFPTEEKIIITFDLLTWYSVDIDDGSVNTLFFN